MRAKRKSVPAAPAKEKLTRVKARGGKPNRPPKRAANTAPIIDLTSYPGLAAFGATGGAMAEGLEKNCKSKRPRWAGWDVPDASVNPILSFGEVALAIEAAQSALAALPESPERESAYAALCAAHAGARTGWLDAAYVHELANSGRRMFIDDVPLNGLWEVTFHGAVPLQGIGTGSLMKAVKAAQRDREDASL